MQWRTRIGMSWGALVSAIVLGVVADYPLNFVLFGILGFLATASRRGLSTPSIKEMVEDNPKYWRVFGAPYYASLVVVGLYMAFKARQIIDFLTDNSLGMAVLLVILLAPLVPSIYAHDKRYFTDKP
jgi:hypothetical protein